MESGTFRRAGGAFSVGGWSVDAKTCRISRGAQEHRLRPMLMELLVLLAENAGQVVTKEQILERLWDGRFVGESVLASNIARLRGLLGDSIANPSYIETISKRGYRLIAPVDAGEPAPPRLAVLPFENLNRDPEEEYFADGMADNVITELGRIAGLLVISRQSVLRFKGTQKSLPDIARELKVDAVVEGSALHAGPRVRITAQLIQAEPERHLWAESYECDLGDVLAVQARVARAIALSVHAALTPQDLARLSSAPRVNREAHLAYLKARYHGSQWTEDGLRKALAYLQQAIGIDPTYAPSYVTLAQCLAALGFWGHAPIRQVYPTAKQAAVKALDLDESLGEGHAVLGLMYWHLDWNLEGGEREIRRGIELTPSSEYARFAHALFLLLIRRDPEKCLEQARLALELDPLSLNTNFIVAWMLMFAGEYERAIDQARKTLDLYPNALHGFYALGWAHGGQSKWQEAAGDFERAAAVSRDAITLGYLGHVYARCGQRSAAQAVLGELLDKARQECVQEFCFVPLYTALGDLDRAFESLEKCYEERDSRLFWLRVFPGFDPLRSDPRYDGLLRRLGLAA